MRLKTLCIKDFPEKEHVKSHQLPIYATSSFEFDTVEEGAEQFMNPTEGLIYSRFKNPTTDSVAKKIALLEMHGTGIQDGWGIMTSSGMSAITTLLLSELSAGDAILTQGNLYGGTTELITKVLSKNGIEVVLTNLTDLNSVRDVIKKNSKLKVIYFETPSNPALDCIDIAGIGELAKENGLVVIVDNTFCTPVLQQPFKANVDYVIHSTTKYINGHGNSISGVIIGHGRASYEKVWSTMKLIGTNCNPWDAWLVNNGMKTLAIRMQHHSANGSELARFLRDHPNVASVNYLGLENHPFHEVAKSQMIDFGGMLCFEVKGGLEQGKKFMNKSKLGVMAPTMGDIDTLILHPASMSHLNVPEEIRKRNGISDSMIRVSVGLEDIEDLKEDFDQALV